jgi:hypothetical protein
LFRAQEQKAKLTCQTIDEDVFDKTIFCLVLVCESSHITPRVKKIGLGEGQGVNIDVVGLNKRWLGCAHIFED